MFPNCYIIILHHPDMFIKITTRKGCLSFYDFNMRLTNVVYQGEMNCVLNLNFLTQQLINVRYNPRSFPGVIYQNRKIGGNCLIFSNGKINCNGPCESFSQGLKKTEKVCTRHTETRIRCTFAKRTTSHCVCLPQNIWKSERKFLI